MLTIKGTDLSTKENLLRSGLSQFLLVGYEKANLRKICKDAGVTTGAFYKYFTDKEELFSELVKPLANNIEKIYHSYEEEGFDEYNLSIPISKETIKKVLDLKRKGSIQTVKYLFSMRDIFELLVFQSYGTKYENFLDLLIEVEDKNQRQILDMIHGEQKSSEMITDESIHLIDHAYYNALSHAVTHAESERDLEKNVQIIADFFNEGWKKIRGI
ncbi:MAG: TetR/AcrR family transcriptional regulator [Tissierellia bacterium]|nr:TetR/AcrR family transcriptional regulator [Tissierellia bacterium]